MSKLFRAIHRFAWQCHLLTSSRSAKIFAERGPLSPRAGRLRFATRGLSGPRSLDCGFAALMLAAGCLGNAMAAGQIGFLFADPPQSDAAQLIHWTKQQGYDAKRLAAWPEGKFKAEGNDLWLDLSLFGLIWLDAGQPIVAGKDPGPLPESCLEPKTRTALQDYVRNGGTLVLSTLAMRYAVDLRIESRLPEEWGQFQGGARVGFRPQGTNELFRSPDALITGDGAHLFRWMGYRRSSPIEGQVLARHWQETNFIQIVRWPLGKGQVVGLASLPWLATDNAQLAGAEQFTRSLFTVAQLTPDPALVLKAAADQRALGTISLAELKLSEISITESAEKKSPAGAYARLTADGFVVGNESLERRIKLKPALHTTSIWNKLSDEVVPVGAAEFRLTFGREQQQFNLGPADFRIVGEPLIRETSGVSTVEVVLERTEAPALRLKLRYAADGSPQIRKSLRLENAGPSEVFLREVWLDTLRFGEPVEIVPYTVLAAFARSKQGGMWVCQSLPYSIPSSDVSARWLAVAYPPCERLAPGAVHESESAFLTAVRLTGRRSEPSRMTHQISSYGPFKDPHHTLDEAEIESCLDFVDRHGTQVRQSAVLHFSYHDYATLGTTDFLPYVKGPGGGWPAMKEWLDRSAAYGVQNYLLYPDIGAWLPVPEAERLLNEQIVPYTRQLGMSLSVWFSAYTASWYGGRGLKDGKVLASFSDPETEQWLVELLGEMIRKWDLGVVEPDQANIMIDRAYDQELGFPGTLPLSPYLYREYQTWDRILKSLRRQKPDLQWGIGHFGNNQAPLFAGINTLNYWCEPHDTVREYKSLRDRHPAISPIKAVADGYRREQFWFQRERFVPFRLMVGNVNFQIGTHQATAPEGEPITQHFRYLLLQNLALHPNFALWGLDAMTVKGWFGAREQAFARQWFDFQRVHARELSERPFLPAGEPAYGKVEIYSYGDRGGGWVFLVNPNFVSAQARLRVGPETGFNASEPYAVREFGPQERWCLVGGKPEVSAGASVAVSVPGYTVTVLQLTPARTAWKSLKHIHAGAVVTEDGKFSATPGEVVTAAEFDVSDPSQPRRVSGSNGTVPGTSPRLEFTEWRVRAGDSNAALGDGFQDGDLVHFEPSPQFGDKFALADFAGAVLWDLQRDPLANRVTVAPDSLRPPAAPSRPVAARNFREASAATGYWLATECELDQPPAQGLVALQCAVPERVEMKLWINGRPQQCARAFNDLCVLNATGLTAGTNRLVLWLGER